MPSLPEFRFRLDLIVTGRQVKSNVPRLAPLPLRPLTSGRANFITAPASRFYPLRPVCQNCFPENAVNFRRALILLAAAALLLPILTVILVATARLLAAMQDVAGAAVVDRIALAVGVAWVTDLVTLVIVQAVHSAGPPE